MTERCSDCGRTLVATMDEFWKNPSYSCPSDVTSMECTDTAWLDLICAQGHVDRLKAQAQRDQETIAAARKVIEAADKLRDDYTTLFDDNAASDFDTARAEFAKVEG